MSSPKKNTLHCSLVSAISISLSLEYQKQYLAVCHGSHHKHNRLVVGQCFCELPQWQALIHVILTTWETLLLEFPDLFPRHPTKFYLSSPQPLCQGLWLTHTSSHLSVLSLSLSVSVSVCVRACALLSTQNTEHKCGKVTYFNTSSWQMVCDRIFDDAEQSFRTLCCPNAQLVKQLN